MLAIVLTLSVVLILYPIYEQIRLMHTRRVEDVGRHVADFIQQIQNSAPAVSINQKEEPFVIDNQDKTTISSSTIFTYEGGFRDGQRSA